MPDIWGAFIMGMVATVIGSLSLMAYIFFFAGLASGSAGSAMFSLWATAFLALAGRSLYDDWKKPPEKEEQT